MWGLAGEEEILQDVLHGGGVAEEVSGVALPSVPWLLFLLLLLFFHSLISIPCLCIEVSVLHWSVCFCLLCLQTICEVFAVLLWNRDNYFSYPLSSLHSSPFFPLTSPHYSSLFPLAFRYVRIDVKTRSLMYGKSPRYVPPVLTRMSHDVYHQIILIYILPYKSSIAIIKLYSHSHFYTFFFSSACHTMTPRPHPSTSQWCPT